MLPDVPKGWRLVPETPTPAMLNDGEWQRHEAGGVYGIYRAMILAAPPPPKEQPDAA